MNDLMTLTTNMVKWGVTALQCAARCGQKLNEAEGLFEGGFADKKELDKIAHHVKFLHEEGISAAKKSVALCHELLEIEPDHEGALESLELLKGLFGDEIYE